MEVAPKHTQKLKSYVIWQDPTKKTMIPVFLEHLAVLTKGSTQKLRGKKSVWIQMISWAAKAPGTLTLCTPAVSWTLPAPPLPPPHPPASLTILTATPNTHSYTSSLFWSFLNTSHKYILKDSLLKLIHKRIPKHFWCPEISWFWYFLNHLIFLYSLPMKNLRACHTCWSGSSLSYGMLQNWSPGPKSLWHTFK